MKNEHKRKVALEPKAMFTKLVLSEQIFNPSKWVNIWLIHAQEKSEWLFICPRARSFVFVSLLWLGTFRSVLSTPFTWLLYKLKKGWPHISNSWNPSPGINNWNSSSVEEKLPDFSKILTPGYSIILFIYIDIISNKLSIPDKSIPPFKAVGSTHSLRRENRF